MHHYTINFGKAWNSRKYVNILCKEEDLKTIAMAIYHGHGNDCGFCVAECEDGTSITFADCM